MSLRKFTFYPSPKELNLATRVLHIVGPNIYPAPSLTIRFLKTELSFQGNRPGREH